MDHGRKESNKEKFLNSQRILHKIFLGFHLGWNRWLIGTLTFIQWILNYEVVTPLTPTGEESRPFQGNMRDRHESYSGRRHRPSKTCVAPEGYSSWTQSRTLHNKQTKKKKKTVTSYKLDSRPGRPLQSPNHNRNPCWKSTTSCSRSRIYTGVSRVRRHARYGEDFRRVSLSGSTGVSVRGIVGNTRYKRGDGVER